MLVAVAVGSARPRAADASRWAAVARRSWCATITYNDRTLSFPVCRGANASHTLPEEKADEPSER
jgi:hypothetical protein